MDSIRFATIVIACAAASAQTPPQGAQPPARRQRPTYEHPGWKPTPPQTAMPKTSLKVEEHKIQKAKFPAVDVHFHAGFLHTPADYQKLISIMDQVGVAMLVNLDGASGAAFDQYLKNTEPYKDRIITMARLNYDGINEPGWSQKMTGELERCFRAGAGGLKIAKELGLDLKNKDGSFIQCDDPRLDPIWELCAKYGKPIVHHVNDQVDRFLPIGPENERYEAGLWRDNPAENYYGTGQPGFEEINRHREAMLDKHPNTIFILAHIAHLGYDLARVGAMLDKHPNMNVDLSAAIQEVGRQPFTARKFLIKYQDRVFFGTDGGTARMNDLDGFWRPHWRFFETQDEYFDHPAQMLSPEGAPLHGRWKIYGVDLPDEVIRKIYYQNAMRYYPAVKANVPPRLAAAGLQ
jgi:predicted TIM-barrel fold metal-dependent hydrolase